jgi:hypothetical protein
LAAAFFAAAFLAGAFFAGAAAGAAALAGAALAGAAFFAAVFLAAAFLAGAAAFTGAAAFAAAFFLATESSSLQSQPRSCFALAPGYHVETATLEISLYRPTNHGRQGATITCPFVSQSPTRLGWLSLNKMLNHVTHDAIIVRISKNNASLISNNLSKNQGILSFLSFETRLEASQSYALHTGTEL